MAKRKRGSGGLYVGLLRFLLTKNSTPRGKAERIFKRFITKESQADWGAFLSWIKETDDITDISWTLNALIRSRILASPPFLHKNQALYIVCQKTTVEYGFSRNSKPGYINVFDKYVRNNPGISVDKKRIGFKNETDAQAFANALIGDCPSAGIEIFKTSRDNEEGALAEVKKVKNLLGHRWTLGVRNKISEENGLTKKGSYYEEKFPSLEAIRCGSK